MRQAIRILILLLCIFFSPLLSGQTFGDLVDSAKGLMFAPDSSALFVLNEACELAESDVDLAIALKYKGIWNYYRRLNSAALDLYHESLDILEHTGENSGHEKANVCNNIGLVLEDTGEIDSAMSYYTKSMDLYYLEKDTSGLVHLSYPNSIGLFILQGNYPKALEFSLKMLELSEKSGDLEHAADAYDFAGSILEIQENFQGARSSYEAALSMRMQIGDSLALSSSYTNLGIIYYREELYDSALNYTLKALEIKRKYNDFPGISSAYNNLGLIYQAMDSLELSLEQYLHSYEAGSLVPGNKASLVSGINIVAIALEMNDLDMAEKYAIESYRQAKRFNMAKLRKEAALNLSLVRAQRGQYREAYEYLKESRELQDSLFNEEMTRKLTEKQLSYEYNKTIQLDSIKNAEAMHRAQLSYEENISRQRMRLTIVVFSLILVVLVFVIIVSYNRNRQRIQKAALEKKSTEIETRLLRAQMNPHFIFNSMNSIQNFISRNDSLQAERYLAKFARLIRLILDNSAKNFVLLEDEISLVENYLEIESLRLDGKLSYEVNVGNELDVEELLIPSMLIQPYVENSILHGIIPKPEGGKITVCFKKLADCSCLKVIITDDGIGREASELRKEQQGSGHKSVGMHITRDRLALLSRYENREAHVNIEDMTDHGKPSGTRVEIVLPIKMQ